MTVARAQRDDYLRGDWDLPHPYNHVWLRSLERLADRIARELSRILRSARISTVPLR